MRHTLITLMFITLETISQELRKGKKRPLNQKTPQQGIAICMSRSALIHAAGQKKLSSPFTAERYTNVHSYVQFTHPSLEAFAFIQIMPVHDLL